MGLTFGSGANPISQQHPQRVVTAPTYCLGVGVVIHTADDTWTCRQCGAQGNMPVHGHKPGEDDRDALPA